MISMTEKCYLLVALENNRTVNILTLLYMLQHMLYLQSTTTKEDGIIKTHYDLIRV